MSERPDQEPGGHGVEDEDLPEDLRPGDDNPLAEGLDDSETAGDLGPGELLEEGKSAEQDTDDTDDPDDPDDPDDTDTDPDIGD